MRVSVAFHTVTVLVPCGDGECTVGELIEKAIVRFKKCTNKVSTHRRGGRGGLLRVQIYATVGKCTVAGAD